MLFKHVRLMSGFLPLILVFIAFFFFIITVRSTHGSCIFFFFWLNKLVRVTSLTSFEAQWSMYHHPANYCFGSAKSRMISSEQISFKAIFQTGSTHFHPHLYMGNSEHTGNLWDNTSMLWFTDSHLYSFPKTTQTHWFNVLSSELEPFSDTFKAVYLIWSPKTSYLSRISSPLNILFGWFSNISPAFKKQTNNNLEFCINSVKIWIYKVLPNSLYMQ